MTNPGLIDRKKLHTAKAALDCLKRAFKNTAPSQNDALICREARQFLEFVIPKLEPKKSTNVMEALEKLIEAKKLVRSSQADSQGDMADTNGNPGPTQILDPQ